MRNDADAIAWVDADDIVYPGALNQSFEIIENNNVGLVYTDECRIDLDDNNIKMSSCGEKTLWDLASHPRCVHHLSVTKKNTITDRVLDIFKRTEVPLDWAMKVDAASRYGMKHVPILGYGWRFHATQITAGSLLDQKMCITMQEIRNEFREWISGVRQTQQFQISQK